MCPVRRIMRSWPAASLPAGGAARLRRCAGTSGCAAKAGCQSIPGPSADGQLQSANSNAKLTAAGLPVPAFLLGARRLRLPLRQLCFLAPPVQISLHKVHEPYIAAQALSWPDRPDYPHTELLEVQEPDPFIPAAATATASSGRGLYPSGGVNSHLDGWERYRWLMHDD